MSKKEILNGIAENRSNPIFIKKAFLLIISALLLVFSFLPIVSYKYEDNFWGYLEIEDPIKIKVSPVRNIAFTIDAFLTSPWEYVDDKFDEVADRYEEEYYNLSSKEKQRLLEDLLYLAERQDLQGDHTAKIPFIVGTLVSLGYIALAGALFVFALRDILAFFKGESFDSKRVLKLLSAIPIASILKYFATSSAMYRTYLFVGADVKVGSGVVLSIVFSILGLIGLMAYSWLFEGLRFDMKRHGSRVITLGLAIFAIMTVFMPVMRMSLTAEFDDGSRETTVKVYYDSGFFGSLDSSEDEISEYQETMEDGYISYRNDTVTDSYGYLSTINSFGNYSVSSYRSGSNSQYIDSKLEYLFSVDGGYEVHWLMNLVPVFMLAFGASIGVLAQRQIYILVSDEEKESKRSKKMLIIALVAAVLAIALVSVFMGKTMSDVSMYTGDSIPSNVEVKFGLSIGAGCVFSILLWAVFSATAFAPRWLQFENAEAKIPETAESNASSGTVAMPQLFARFARKKEPQKSMEDIVSELKQYKELLDSGIITQEEFDSKKEELLNLSKKEN